MATKRVAGISWCEREDYPRFLEIMEDAHIFAPIYDEWRKKAEVQQRRFEDLGFTVVRAVINPEEFPAWCAREGLKVDAKARTAFATDFAGRQISN